MRTYIIGNDGIALCRKTPATVSNGEIIVASKEELHAAPLNGKRLLALWNALPGVDKRRKVGERAALIDQLWSGLCHGNSIKHTLTQCLAINHAAATAFCQSAVASARNTRRVDREMRWR